MSLAKWIQYDPQERITIAREGSSPLEAEFSWRKRFASNGTLSYQIRATVFDEARKPLFHVADTWTTPADPAAKSAIQRKVTDLINANSWVQDETYAVHSV